MIRETLHKNATLTTLATFIIVGILAGAGGAFATPTGGTILAGGGNISTAVNATNPAITTTTITQPNAKGVYSWTSFNTTAGQTVQYVQPNSNSIALNLIGGGPTTFDGRLLANGNVWLINPQGMLFGNATINVGGLLLSTASIADPANTGFYNNTSGSYSFSQPGSSNAAIVLNGTSVTATGNGSGVDIMAPAIAVQNDSAISAPGGNVALLAGSTFGATTTNVDFNGDGLISYQYIGAPTSAVVPNAGSSVYVGGASTISANTVVAEASVSEDAVLDHVINLGGQYDNGVDNQVVVNHVPYNQATNPEHVIINGHLTTLEYVSSTSAPAAVSTTPTGGTILAGTGSITNPTSNLTLIDQTSEKGVYSWTSYNTSANQTVQYVQPNNNAIALNLITGGSTNFDGTLLANGNVWLINPSGMLFGNATINVGGLLLSTAGIANPTTTGFYGNTSGAYAFNQPGIADSTIILNGTSVTASGNGSGIDIMAPAIAVQNDSTLSAPGGNVALLAGSTFSATTTNVDGNGDGLINYQTINLPTSAVVPNAGSSIYVGGASTISANTVVAEASVYQNAVLDHVINLGGQYDNGVDNKVVVNRVPYNEATNPEHVVINGRLTTLEYLPAAPVTPPSTPPSSTSTTVLVPTSAQNADVDIAPLTRPLTSLVEESETNAPVANDTYARPYFVSLPTSFEEGKLTLLSPSAGGASGSSTNLGNLSPAAGGDMANAQDNLGSLSPSAGGSITSAPSGASCANAYLDTAWFTGSTRRCIE